MTNRTKRFLVVSGLLFASVAALTAAAGALLGAPWMIAVAELLGAGLLLLITLWLGWRILRAFLWRVGRRLGFSYFLIGILPIPMVLLLAGLNAYLVAGFFLGHLFRDALTSLEHDLSQAAISRLEGSRSGRAPADDGRVTYARYREGRKVSGSDRFPDRWPTALRATLTTDEARASDAPHFCLLADGSPALVSASGDAEDGVLATVAGDLSEELTRRSGFWVDLYRSDDPREQDALKLRLGQRVFALRPFVDADRAKRRAEYFRLGEVDTSVIDRPWLWWSEISGSLLNIEDGELVSDYVAATLNGTIRTVARQLLSGSAEFDAAVWAGLVAVTSLLATIYALAVVMAVLIIFTLTRAVNRLSQATEAVRGGHFSARIPVRRKDQIGELQHSFNQMAENLERLVATAAQKEILDNELRIARNLQKSLLPTSLPTSKSVDFATLFEPSAAIGGDYFDIFRLDDDCLAVVVADVSGHGLPTGLRMAMLKAALGILVEDKKPPREILRRLSTMIRADRKGHFFATATVAVVDFRAARLDLTNAGHPPTYRLREGRVEEILLPGNPLGALGDDYGEQTIALEPGDVLVWLSDGLIEATDAAGEPFGYERVAAAIAGSADSAVAVRDRLVRAVADHVGDEPAEDDRTLVAMRYRAPSSVPAGSSPSDE